MAITVIQQPQTPNYSRNELVYVLSSTNVNALEFQFVVDIYVGGSLVHRTRKQPNPTGRGAFDLQTVIERQLDYDLGALGATSTVLGADSSKTFQIRFGEEFLENGDQALFVDLATADDMVVIKGQNDVSTTDLGVATIPSQLSRSATSGIRIHRDDTMTISYYDATQASVVHAPIAVPTSGATYSQTVNGVTYNFDVYDTRSYLGETRFAWYNDKGGIDYYTADRVHTLEVAAQRASYLGSRVEFGRSTSSNKERGNSNVFRQGTTVYKVDYESVYVSEFRFQKDQDEELTAGLLMTDRAFVQVGTQYVPIIILTDRFARKRPTAAPSNFPREVMWRFSNELRGI